MFLDSWWIVYAVVFGVLFVIIFLLLIALLCIECSGGSNKERYCTYILVARESSRDTPERQMMMMIDDLFVFI